MEVTYGYMSNYFNHKGRQFLSRSAGDESRDLPSFADFSLALSYIMLKCKVWTPRGMGGRPFCMPQVNSEKSDIQLMKINESPSKNSCN